MGGARAKGPGIKNGEGGGVLQRGKIVGAKLYAPLPPPHRPEDRVKLLVPPPPHFKGWKRFAPPFQYGLNSKLLC